MKAFEFKIPMDVIDDKQRKLIVKANNAAGKAFNKDITRRGAVFCQLWMLPEEFRVKVKGTFIPYEYTSRINDILQEYVESQKAKK